MKAIKTNGITFLEILEAGSDWYCGTDYACGDLYEAEEIFQNTKTCRPNRLIFVHHPDGLVYEPITLKPGQYFGRPAQCDGHIYLFYVDFNSGLIKIFDGSDDPTSIHPDSPMAEIPLSKVEDCYNLLLRGTPLMLIRQGGDDLFEAIWPERFHFPIEINESFLHRKSDKLYFSKWYEDPDYREEVIIRAYPTGEILERIPGSIFITPSGEEWILGYDR